MLRRNCTVNDTYHKWTTYDRLAVDLTVILGQILRCFVNRANGV